MPLPASHVLELPVGLLSVTIQIGVSVDMPTGHWCRHRVRFPGVALAGCLMTAKLAEHLTRVGLGRGGVSWTSLDRGDERRVDRRLLRRQEKRMRGLNTEALLSYRFGDNQTTTPAPR